MSILDKINKGSTIIVEIPIIFHLIDPILLKEPSSFWQKYINEKIITCLNKDFNVSYANYNNTLRQTINTLFADACPDKKKHYLNTINTLPTINNLKWIFTLHSIIIKPENVFIRHDTNEHIFRITNVVDPERFLNIIIAPGLRIMGLSVFPFDDRNPSNISQINTKFAYRNAILINTCKFINTEHFRTFTHEIGHWCGLFHPFNNNRFRKSAIKKYALDKSPFNKAGGDLIKDTFPQTKPTFGRVNKNIRYANIFEKNNITPNFFNFMDHTHDSQMCMFTQCQMLQMLTLIDRFRPNLININSLNSLRT